MYTRALILLASLVLLAAAAAPAAGAADTKMADVTIPASDGVNLVGDVYLPGDGKGRYPAVVDMEPYGRSTLDRLRRPRLRARQHRRARQRQERRRAVPAVPARAAGRLRRRRVGRASSRGATATSRCTATRTRAITSLLGAALQPPHLDAVVVGHPPTDPYRDVIWHNGLYDQGFVGQWFAGQTAAQSVGARPAAAVPRPRPAAVRDRDAADPARRAGLPGALGARASMEPDQGPRLRLHRLAGHVQPRRPAPHRRPRVASTSCWSSTRAPTTGPATPARSARPTTTARAAVALSAPPPKGEDQAWLDRFLKGERNGIEDKPRVRYFDLGDRTWHAAPSWRSVRDAS